MKLVRDKAKERYPKDKYIEIDNSLIDVFLLKKLHEEVEEISRDMNDILEYADVYECLVCLAERNGFSLEDIQKAAKEKADKKGSFKKGIVLIMNFA